MYASPANNSKPLYKEIGSCLNAVATVVTSLVRAL